MDVFKAIFDRRSIRKFKDNEIESTKINKIVEAGIWAPSAGNIQSWDVIIVKDNEKKLKLAVAAYMRDFIGEASVVMVICANIHRSGTIYNDRGKELYCIQDAACATQNMLLAAYALGLGACWVGAFDEEYVARILKIPSYLKPVTIMPLGILMKIPFPLPAERWMKLFGGMNMWRDNK